MNRRTWLTSTAAATSMMLPAWPAGTAAPSRRRLRDLVITNVTVTPVAFPDPPILAASGCHGPYYLRTVLQIETADGVTGIAETLGGQHRTDTFERLKEKMNGRSVLDFQFLREQSPGPAIYAAWEMACLDAIGRAKNLRLCDLLGGPVRDEVEFASYLFYRYAADNPIVLADKRIVDDRGAGEKSLDQWGEVRTPEAMAQMAWNLHQRYGFRVHKLKGGVLDPKIELRTLHAINERFEGKHALRIDPNARWKEKTAIRIGKQLQDLPLEYYEDPVDSREGMARVRRETGLKMATNVYITSFNQVTPTIRTESVDVVLGDTYMWGGIQTVQALGLLAAGTGWGVGQHSASHAGISMAAMIHLGAVVPRMTYASDTHYIHLAEGHDIINGPKLPIRGGKMAIPEGPGLGVEIDPDKLARAHELYVKCGMRQRDDKPLMRRLVPGWEPTKY